MCGMTYVRTQRDAFALEDEESIEKAGTRACASCGKEFHKQRRWQRQE